MNFPCLKKWWGFDLVWFWFAFVLGGFLQRIEEGVDSWYMPEAIKLKPLYNETLSRSILIFFLFHTVFKTPKSCLAEEFKLCLEVCCRENGCPATTHFSLKLFQWVFISNCIMIQGPRVGQRTEEKWAEPSWIFPGNVPSAMQSFQSETKVAGKMAQWLRTLVFAEDPGLIPTTKWWPTTSGNSILMGSSGSWYRAEGLIHTLVPLTHRDISPLHFAFSQWKSK